jgi:hypothetical protein
VDDKELTSLWILTFFDRREFIAIVNAPNRVWPGWKSSEQQAEAIRQPRRSG